jgi:two-component system response regulator YesN
MPGWRGSMILLIVDDDKEIVEGLRQTMNWAQCDIDRVLTADDGVPALDILESREVDIVITDIKMPGMDGLALAREIRERSIDVEIILLSGFGEFEYAQKAIRYGIVGYALKPVNIDECIALVNKAVDAKKGRMMGFKNEEILHKSLFQKKLADVMLGISEDIDSLKTEQSFTSVTGVYSLIVLSFEECDVNFLDFSEILSGFSCCVPKALVFAVDVGKIVIYIGASMTTSELRYTLEESLLETELNYDVKIKVGVSGDFGDVAFVKDAYEQTLNVLEYKYYDHRSRYFFVKKNREDDEAGNGETYALSALKDIGKMSKLLSEQTIEEIFDSLAESRVGVADAKAVIYLILSNFERYCVQVISHGKLGKSIGHARESIAKNWNIEQDKATIADLRKEIRTREDNLTKSVKSNMVERAKDYIEENYSKALDVTTLAKEFDKNANYFSHIFCETSGHTFSEYLNMVRIEKAKQLLLQSNDTVYAIAKFVGYNNERYFIKIFKRLVGLTPTQYRNMN